MCFRSPPYPRAIRGPSGSWFPYITRIPLALTAFCAYDPELDLLYVRPLASANEKVVRRSYGRERTPEAICSMPGFPFSSTVHFLSGSPLYSSRAIAFGCDGLLTSLTHAKLQSVGTWMRFEV